MNQEIYLTDITDDVMNFYALKRGSLPTLTEAVRYFNEECGELLAEVRALESCCYNCENGCDIEVRKHLAKEAGDVMFTLIGVCIAAGVNLDEAFRRVVDSNMTKYYTPDGKIQKGSDYREPDMSSALA